MRNKILIFLPIAAIVLFGAYQMSRLHQDVDFNTEVKPILNKRCISCHGGVKKSGGFSLMTREEALQATDSGQPAIIPGDPHGSAFIQRLLSEDPEERMPYEADPLPEEEIAILRRWVRQGAPWGLHWSYQPIAKVERPKSRHAFGLLWSGQDQEQHVNGVDHFIREKLREIGLSPSPEADRATLLRRLSLDLIGIPAPDRLAQRYLADDSPGAYERLVDSLLALPQFGEKWAVMWLDIARYADSKGFERDPHRTIWPYRDWVIDAFNRDLPYDQFLTEQLAGDLLPNPTDAQYIATGFHRNTTTNDEGGTDNEEFRVAAVVDRVNTTWEGIMGTTFACTQCHGHPYDPFNHEDYYEFMAFLNNTRDEDTAADYPWLRIFSPEDSLKLGKLKGWLQENTSEERTDEIITFLKTWQPSVNGIAADEFVNAELYDTKTLTFRNHGVARLPGIDLNGKSMILYRYQSSRERGRWTIRLDSLQGTILGQVNLPKTRGGWQYATLEFSPVQGKHDLYLTYENPTIQDDKGTGLRFDWLAFTNPFPGRDRPGYAANLQRFWELMDASTGRTLIMFENTPGQSRQTHVFDRGNWLVKAQKVSPNVPNIFPPVPDDVPRNRLGLAKWLTDPQHPLTSRTMVNRIWKQLFGAGIVQTLEDLGSQGEPPTHQELLDWLAWRFMHEHDWSMKAMIREIVLSAAYRQKSNATPEMLEKDPYNRYYARAPRPRLAAEQVRDQALAISGLLSKKMGGPSVMPYQPEGIWSTPYNNAKWHVSEGEDRYRRSVYTYWKRSTPYPAFMTFDAATREVCSARRVNTNTPLQALVTLNDPVYHEAAQYFARRIVEETETAAPAALISTGYRLATGKNIPDRKRTALEELYAEALKDFSEEPEKTEQFLNKIAEKKAEMAALTIVANAILNLDEVITRS